jgi:transposase InsO family protein/transposase-like protein
MQWQHVGYRIKGFYAVAKYATRYLEMASQKAEYKLKVLKFWEDYGLEATQSAFGVSRRTLYLWKAQHRSSGGLEERSKRPKQVRQRQWPAVILDEIQRLRKEHPNLGKEKLYPLLLTFCEACQLRCPKPRTIGRIMASHPHKMRQIPQKITPKGKRKERLYYPPKKRKPKQFKALFPGHCVAFDTIERHRDGCRRYIITFIDLYSRYALAFATTSHASLAAQQFYLLVTKLFPYPIEHVLTDNGSEFKKSFAKELQKQHKIHWHTYPKTPKMNAHNERFNRTIQEEFVEYHLDALIDPPSFNQKLIEYLIWYNTLRPHWGLQLKSPIQFLMLHPTQQQCNMWWPNTIICIFKKITL